MMTFITSKSGSHHAIRPYEDRHHKLTRNFRASRYHFFVSGSFVLGGLKKLLAVVVRAQAQLVSLVSL